MSTTTGGSSSSYSSRSDERSGTTGTGSTGSSGSSSSCISGSTVSSINIGSGSSSSKRRHGNRNHSKVRKDLFYDDDEAGWQEDAFSSYNSTFAGPSIDTLDPIFSTKDSVSTERKSKFKFLSSHFIKHDDASSTNVTTTTTTVGGSSRHHSEIVVFLDDEQDDDSQSSSSRRTLTRCVAICLLLPLLAAVIVPVFVMARNGPSNNTNNENNQESVLDGDGTSAFDGQSDTVPQVSTELCQEAPIVQSGSIVHGSATEEAAVTALLQQQQFLPPTNENVIMCHPNGMELDEDAYGMWYQVVGTGYYVSIDTCGGDGMTTENFDATAISVYQGECGDMTCAETATYESCQGTTDNKATWLAEPNEVYYILVHATYPMQDFVLSYSTEAFAVNTNCNLAAPLQPPFLGQEIEAVLLDWEDDSNNGAVEAVRSSSSSPQDDFPACNGNTNRGVWYHIEGTGQVMTVSTCHATVTLPQQGQELMSPISFFTGSSCGELECLDHFVEAFDCSDEQGNVEESMVGIRAVFPALDGVDYYVLFHGHDHEEEPGFGQVQSFLDITQRLSANVFDAETVTQCNNAKALPVDGSTELGILDKSQRPAVATRTSASAPTCGTATISNEPSAWYVVRGTGGDILVSTCNDVAASETQISLYVGYPSCESLQCFDGSSNGCDNPITISNTEVGGYYFLLLQGQVGSNHDEIYAVQLQSL